MINVSEKCYKKDFNRNPCAYIFTGHFVTPPRSTQIVNIHYGWASTLFNYILQSHINVMNFNNISVSTECYVICVRPPQVLKQYHKSDIAICV